MFDQNIVMSISAGYLTVGNYEDGFLTLKEQQILGNLNIASAAMYGMKNSLKTRIKTTMNGIT